MMKYLSGKYNDLGQHEISVLRPEYFISWFTIFFSDLGWGDEKKSSENEQLTGHFQSFFFFLISPEKTVKLVM